MKPLTLPLVYGGESGCVPPRGFEPPLHGISDHRLFQLVYGGMARAELASLRRSESHRRGLAYETRLRTRTLPAQELVGTLGLAPSWSFDDCFTGSLGQLYRQRSPGVIDGTRTRFSVVHIHVPRLLRHRSQSARSESNTHRSLIGRLHDRRATGGKRKPRTPRGLEPLGFRLLTRQVLDGKECATGINCMQAAGFEPASFRVQVENPHQRPANGQRAKKADAQR